MVRKRERDKKSKPGSLQDQLDGRKGKRKGPGAVSKCDAMLPGEGKGGRGFDHNRNLRLMRKRKGKEGRSEIAARYSFWSSLRRKRGEERKKEKGEVIKIISRLSRLAHRNIEGKGGGKGRGKGGQRLF